MVNEESAMEIEISKIHPFKNHPFKVLDDEKMQDLVESVRINGVLTPVPVSYTHLDVYKRQEWTLTILQEKVSIVIRLMK